VGRFSVHLGRDKVMAVPELARAPRAGSSYRPVLVLMALIVELARKFGRYGMTALNVLERLTALFTE